MAQSVQLRSSPNRRQTRLRTGRKQSMQADGFSLSHAQLFNKGLRWIGHYFRQRGVVMRHAQEISRGPVVIHYGDQFVDQFTCFRADDLRAKEFACRSCTKEFHEAMR